MTLCRIYGYDSALRPRPHFPCHVWLRGRSAGDAPPADCYRGIMGPRTLNGLPYLEETSPLPSGDQTLARIAA
jgi:hypothetical protein